MLLLLPSTHTGIPHSFACMKIGLVSALTQTGPAVVASSVQTSTGLSCEKNSALAETWILSCYRAVNRLRYEELHACIVLW